MAVVDMTIDGGFFRLFGPTVAYRLVVNVARVRRWPADGLSVKGARERLGAWRKGTTRQRFSVARGEALTTGLTT